MQHKTMFYPSDNEHGFIQCVIKPEQRDAFESLGFVESVDRLKPIEKPKRKKKDKQEPLNLDAE